MTYPIVNGQRAPLQVSYFLLKLDIAEIVWSPLKCSSMLILGVAVSVIPSPTQAFKFRLTSLHHKMKHCRPTYLDIPRIQLAFNIKASKVSVRYALWDQLFTFQCFKTLLSNFLVKKCQIFGNFDELIVNVFCLTGLFSNSLTVPLLPSTLFTKRKLHFLHRFFLVTQG